MGNYKTWSRDESSWRDLIRYGCVGKHASCLTLSLSGLAGQKAKLPGRGKTDIIHAAVKMLKLSSENTRFYIAAHSIAKSVIRVVAMKLWEFIRNVNE
jgi:hypothetical protein